MPVLLRSSAATVESTPPDIATATDLEAIVTALNINNGSEFKLHALLSCHACVADCAYMKNNNLFPVLIMIINTTLFW